MGMYTIRGLHPYITPGLYCSITPPAGRSWITLGQQLQTLGITVSIFTTALPHKAHISLLGPHADRETRPFKYNSEGVTDIWLQLGLSTPPFSARLPAIRNSLQLDSKEKCTCKGASILYQLLFSRLVRWYHYRVEQKSGIHAWSLRSLINSETYLYNYPRHLEIALNLGP